MKYFTVIAFLLLSVFTGCQLNNEDLLDEDNLQLDGRLRLTTLIDTDNTLKYNLNQPFIGSSGQGPILGMQLPDEAEIGMCIHAFDGTNFRPYPSIEGASHQNLLWKNTSAGWSYFDRNGIEAAYYLGKDEAYIHAYYPYTNQANSFNREGLKIQIKPGYTDYMYGKSLSRPNASNPDSKLQMNHALASITFTVKSNGYKGNCLLEAITLHNVTAEGELSVWNGEIESSSLKKDIHVASWTGEHYDPVYANGNTGFKQPLKFDDQLLGYPSISSQARENSLHILVIPQKGKSEVQANGTYMSVRIDGINHQIAFVYNKDGENHRAYEWLSGQNYNYNLVLKANGSLTVDVEDFEAGGDWDIDFANPHIIVQPNGASDIQVPTHFLQDQDKISKKFMISVSDLNNLTWFEASGWKEIWGNNHHGSVNLNPTKGCLALREGGYSNWRLPTFNEYKLMFGRKNIASPLNGSYWVGDYASQKGASIIQNMNHTFVSGATQNNTNIRYKTRCVRDIR